ncbi:MAG: hypothetical protein GEV08_07835 [Acidimicrobiia bacterium]|nr:hypothetical protein [Acidimicrobiia bacterium]
MATIRATCGECGDVVLTAADVRVLLCTHDNSASYTFRCPGCRLMVVKAARGRTVDLLVASGVAMSSWDYPAELREPRGAGGPITHDELLDFHRFLVDDARFTEALTALEGGRH